MAPQGICAFLDWTPEQKAQSDLEYESEKRQLQLQEDWAAQMTIWEADQQRLKDAIDAAISVHLKDELEAVNKTARVSDKDKELFKNFQATCSRWGFEALPACPQAVAVHLAEESVHGAAHISRIARSISLIHAATQMGTEPCSDVLVKALLLRARNEEKATSTPTKGE